MGLRYYRRINMGKGWGLNLSKSGLSTSFRTKWGAFGTKGYSIRTGIPGLSYRKTFTRVKQGDAATIFFLIILATILLYVAILIVWNLGRFAVWSTARLYHALKPAHTEIPQQGATEQHESAGVLAENTNTMNKMPESQ